MLIKPEIDIRPFCVFCHRGTDHVASYTYSVSSGRPYDEIFIRFPAHKRCLLFRKLLRFSGLPAGASVFFGMGFLISRFFPPFKSMPEWPIWLWAVLIIAGAVAGLYCIIRIHFQTVDTIYRYYVHNAVLPEADKAWRR